eukprot:363205-Chlamydomonas_euryale.AAC.10
MLRCAPQCPGSHRPGRGQGKRQTRCGCRKSLSRPHGQPHLSAPCASMRASASNTCTSAAIMGGQTICQTATTKQQLTH